MPSPTPVLIVTGASRGIGAATAHLAAARGYHVCVNYLRQQSAAEKVVNAIRENGGTAVAIQADVSDESTVVRLFDSATEQLGPITALVNNAGTVERQMRLENIDVARLHRHQRLRKFPLRSRSCSPHVHPSRRPRRCHRQRLLRSRPLRFSE